MDLDLSILYSSSGSNAANTVSAVAMYKKLQQQAAENAAEASDSAGDGALAEQVRQLNNAVIRSRNGQFARDNAQVADDAAYFQQRVAEAGSVDELLEDDRFLRVLAEANGMGALYLNNKQKLKDILTSDLGDTSSVARQGSTRELELAKKYNLAAGNGLDNLAALAPRDAAAYSAAKSKTLLSEIAAPSTSAADEAYEYDSEEYQIFIKRSDVQREVTYFEENIGDVKSLDDLFANRRLLNFVLSAFDLEGEEQNLGKIRKILESDLTDENSLANRFSDTRFKAMAEALNVAADGVATLTSDSMAGSLVEKYQRLEYERHLDEQAPGVRAAIEFGRRIEGASSTISLLADAVMREVVTVANAIPKEIAYQEEDAQVAAVAAKVDVNELKTDSDAVEKLVSRYLVLKDSSSTSSPQSYLLSLFS